MNASDQEIRREIVRKLILRLPDSMLGPLEMQEDVLTANRKESRAKQDAHIACHGPASKPCKLDKPLCDETAQRLKQCEEGLEKWRNAGKFFEVGDALLRIREGRLYLATHATSRAYCNERWGFSRSYAWRLIGAAERLRLLPPEENLPVPQNEFQMRPFLKLKPHAFPGAWKQVLSRSKSGAITSETIQVFIDEKFSGHGARPLNRDGFGKSMRALGDCASGELAVLLQEVRRSIQNNQPGPALVALEKVEDLLLWRMTRYPRSGR